MGEGEFTTRDLISFHLDMARTGARFELANVLTQPACRLITVLKNRSAQLAEDERLEAEIDQLIEYENEWGF
jgi:hypothetical protein